MEEKDIKKAIQKTKNELYNIHLDKDYSWNEIKQYLENDVFNEKNIQKDLLKIKKVFDSGFYTLGCDSINSAYFKKEHLIFDCGGLNNTKEKIGFKFFIFDDESHRKKDYILTYDSKIDALELHKLLTINEIKSEVYTVFVNCLFTETIKYNKALNNRKNILIDRSFQLLKEFDNVLRRNTSDIESILCLYNNKNINLLSSDFKENIKAFNNDLYLMFDYSLNIENTSNKLINSKNKI